MSIRLSMILGSGAAGCTAGIYSARAGCRPVLVTGIDPGPGGQLSTTTDVDNYPGFYDTVQGPWLMDQMLRQAERVGVEIVRDAEVTEISKRDEDGINVFDCKTSAGVLYSAYTVVVATGAYARWLGLESEDHYRGYGVSACATCDAPMFKDERVMVVGGGNTAVEEALYLSKHASEVFLVHRRDKLRAEAAMQEKLFTNSKIKVIWNRVLVEVLGVESPYRIVNGALLEDVESGEVEKLPVSGIFIAVGHAPNTKLFRDLVDLDDGGYVVTVPGSSLTSCEGIFAAGDVQDHRYRQAVVAAGSGCMSALDAVKYLSDLGVY